MSTTSNTFAGRDQLVAAIREQQAAEAALAAAEWVAAGGAA